MRDYVESMMHAKVESEPIDVSGIPLYLRGLYNLERWTAFGVPFAMAIPNENPTVQSMAKHRDSLEGFLELPIAFALEGATNYKVTRMLETGLPFIVPDRQIYLPFLGVALNEKRGSKDTGRTTVIEALSPQAQRLALMALYGKLDGTSVTQAANLLGTAKMTASRAFDELQAIDSSLVVTEGRRRTLRPCGNKRALWQQLEPHLSSPVAREHHLNYVPEATLPLGGISALSEYSMLQDNPWPTLAATRAQERALGLTASTRTAVGDEIEEQACVVQVMRYKLETATGQAIDPLSAILSLSSSEKEDPRVASEVENVLEHVLGGENERNR